MARFQPARHPGADGPDGPDGPGPDGPDHPDGPDFPRGPALGAGGAAGWDGLGDPYAPGARGRGPGRKAARYAVPVAVAAIAAGTIGLGPALADAGHPSLPRVTAEQLLTKIAAADPQAVSGSVKVTTDLGLPAGLAGGAAGGLFGDPSGTAVPGDKPSPAAPQSQLTQLLAGTHTLQVAADGPDRQRISILQPAAEYTLIHNGTQLWAYDSASDQAYHAVAPDRRPAGPHRHAAHPEPEKDIPATPQAAARQILTAAEGTASFTVDGTARVAGRSAYELLVRPQHAHATTVGAIRIAVDAETGVPLRVTLTPKGGGAAVFDIRFTTVGFGTPPARTFAFAPPKGVKVTEGTQSGAPRGHTGPQPGPGAGGAPAEVGTGWDTIAVIPNAGGLPAAKGKDGAAGSTGTNGKQQADALLSRFGTRVSGPFGTGTAFHTRLVNALLTDKGTLYVGAVTPSALAEAAKSAGAGR